MIVRLISLMTILALFGCSDRDSRDLKVEQKTAELHGIQVKNQHGRSAFLFAEESFESKVWLVENNPAVLIDQSKIEKLISLINLTLQGDAIELSGAKLEQYGIDSDVDFVELRGQSELLARLLIGDYSEYHEKFFIVLEKENKLLLADKNLIDLLRQNLEFYQVADVYRAPLEIEANEIERIVFTDINGASRQVVRLSDGSWQVASRVGDPVFVEQMLTNLTQTQALHIQHPKKIAELKNAIVVGNLPDLVIAVESLGSSTITELKVWRRPEQDLSLVLTSVDDRLLQLPLSWFRKVYPDLEVLLAAN